MKNFIFLLCCSLLNFADTFNPDATVYEMNILSSTVIDQLVKVPNTIEKVPENLTVKYKGNINKNPLFIPINKIETTKLSSNDSPYQAVFKILALTKKAAESQNLNSYKPFYFPKSFSKFEDTLQKIPNGIDTILSSGKRLEAVSVIMFLLTKDQTVSVLREVKNSGSLETKKTWMKLKKNDDLYKIYLDDSPDPILMDILTYLRGPKTSVLDLIKNTQ